jgi:hypothetical protein
MLQALQEQPVLVEAASAGKLEVLCGDGIGVETLRELAPGLSLPVWCASSGLAPTGKEKQAGLGDETAGVLLSAEIGAALLKVLDRPPGPPIGADLRGPLLGLQLKPGDPAALGRSLAFEESGERAGADLGFVLTSRGPSAKVEAFALNAEGRWTGPWPVATSWR